MRFINFPDEFLVKCPSDGVRSDSILSMINYVTTGRTQRETTTQLIAGPVRLMKWTNVAVNDTIYLFVFYSKTGFKPRILAICIDRSYRDFAEYIHLRLFMSVLGPMKIRKHSADIKQISDSQNRLKVRQKVTFIYLFFFNMSTLSVTNKYSVLFVLFP